MDENVKENTKETDKLMRRLAGGLVGWLTFQQTSLRSRMYKETWMYAPIYEIASARRWGVYPEFPLKLAQSTKRIDFVFYGTRDEFKDNNKVAAIEISYLKNLKKPKKILNDETKLKQLKDECFQGGKFGTIQRYIMIAGKRDIVKAYCERNLLKAMPLFRGRRDRRIGWLYRSPIRIRRKRDEKLSYWCVMVLRVSTGR